MKTKLTFLFALIALALSHSLTAQKPHAMLGVSFAQASGAPTATLTWTQPPTLPAGGTVSVYRCVGTPCTALTSFTLLTSGVAAAGPYVDTTVTAGLYSYYVVNVVNGQPSLASNIATGTLSPPAPTGLTVTAAN